ncbi:MAG: aminoacyl-tRNA hydrolase [Clostridia bacterium]|nr:aminoacyl-tRNA hydrolase [Clostridia bacterium]
MFGRKRSNIDFIVVGLGNPGDKYKNTRHNVGFNVIDYISGRCGIEVKKLKHYAKSGIGTINSAKVLLLKPQTYMNASGLSAADAARYYGIQPQNIIVISDDVSLGVGRVRVRRSGSAGGHNGLKSIIEELHTEEFPRIRIGVGDRPNPEYDLADWVLSTLSAKERGQIAERYENIYHALCYILEDKIDKAMQECN